MNSILKRLRSNHLLFAKFIEILINVKKSASYLLLFIRFCIFYQYLVFFIHGKFFKYVLFGKGFVCLSRKSLFLSSKVRFGDYVRVQCESIHIGSNSYIGHNNYIFGKVRIGEYFMSGPNVCIMGGNHGFKNSKIPMSLQSCKSKGITIGDDVWIGANSTVLDGVKIGNHTIIGAGSVVSCDLDDYGIYSGNPAQIVRVRVPSQIKIIVIPFSPKFLNNLIFDLNYGTEGRAIPYFNLYNKLTELGYEVGTYDKFKKRDISSSDILLAFNHQPVISYQIGQWFNFEKKILVAQEPLNKNNFRIKTFREYCKVLTWNANIIVSDKITRINAYPIVKTKMEWLPLENRKLITNISINKKSNAKGELYSERIKAIELSEKIFETDFEFYGIGWNKATSILEKLKLKKYRHFKSYKSDTTNKFETLRNFKFSLCFENTKLMKGNISEKIFDCFQCGVIPLYWGAPDIANFIPKETFIWREDFETTEDMLLFVKKMSADEINSKIHSIDTFLRSEKMDLFWEDAYVNKIVKTIESIANIVSE